jgi:hypothetical protein
MLESQCLFTQGCCETVKEVKNGTIIRDGQDLHVLF